MGYEWRSCHHDIHETSVFVSVSRHVFVHSGKVGDKVSSWSVWDMNAFIWTGLPLKREVGFECPLVMGFSEFPWLSSASNVAEFILDHRCRFTPQQMSSIFILETIKLAINIWLFLSSSNCFVLEVSFVYIVIRIEICHLDILVNIFGI